MSGFPYASSMGRLKVHLPEFLSKETFATLANAKDLIEIEKDLEATLYGADIAAVAATTRGLERLEVAINRVFVRRCRKTLDISPFAGKPILSAYLRRWDIENISLILSARAQGRLVTEDESFLVSSREIPAGLFAGAMTLDDFRMLLQEPTLEGMAQQLVRFGYGGVVLTRLDAYAQTKDIFPILQALDADYYTRLLDSLRFFQGDEWNIRLFVQSEIDVRNALLLLKGKAAELPADTVLERFIDGGSFPRAGAADAFGARDVPELVTALAPRFPALPDGLPAFQSEGTLASFESALVRERAIRELRRMRSYPLSLAVLFMFLLESELERTDLRRVVYGRQYGVPSATLLEQLIVPRL
jgi:V/A-type H+/Na+-transporting ATPase subunit C